MTFVLETLGCRSEPIIPRSHVSGKVTFGGQPVVAGRIDFIPLAKDSPGPGMATIVDGKFDTATNGGNGVVRGAHMVRLTGYGEKLPENSSNNETEPQKNVVPLFVDYSLEIADLKSPIDIDVPASAAYKP